MRARPVLAVAAAAALLATGCGRSSSPPSAGDDGGSRQSAGPVDSSPAGGAAGDFGALTNVCHGGSPTGAPATGVTATQVAVGVSNDVSFLKNSEVPDAAKVFTAWCNAAGGINGRKLVWRSRDSKIFNVLAQNQTSCQQDFALVGGQAALDGTGVKARVSCLEPAFPLRSIMPENRGSGLQADVSGLSPSYYLYPGEYDWLLNEKYPDSKGAVGVLVGDAPVTKETGAQVVEGIQAQGGTVTYNDIYPILGLSDWTPYATKIKQKNVKGLVFQGQYEDLAKLEAALTNLGYKLDWIDANINSYTDDFVKLLGRSASFQNNIIDLSGLYPPENAAGNPPTQQVIDLYQRYGGGAKVTSNGLRAFSAWLLFAASAEKCGDNLTRRCVFQNATANTAWTGGGLQAPVNLSNPDTPLRCFNIEKATSGGWQPADFQPNTGAYRCGQPVDKLIRTATKPVTLESVGKTMNDVR